MTRPIRVEFEGAVYHLTARGNERQRNAGTHSGNIAIEGGDEELAWVARTEDQSSQQATASKVAQKQKDVRWKVWVRVNLEKKNALMWPALWDTRTGARSLRYSSASKCGSKFPPKKMRNFLICPKRDSKTLCQVSRVDPVCELISPNMKLYFVFCLLVSLTSLSASANADVNDLIKEREATLEEIVKSLDDAISSGNNSAGIEQQAHDSKINLYLFKRDSAQTDENRLNWQRKIVSLEKERYDLLSLRHKSSNSVDILDVLRSKERMLSAEQKLDEMTAGRKSAEQK